MYRPLLTYGLLGLIAILSLSFTNERRLFKGNWQIESVLVEGDTLYHSGIHKYTVDFYNDHMNGWEKTEDDMKYIEKSITSTFNDFKRVKLVFRRKSYSQSTLYQPWDHLSFKGCDKGKYTIENNEIKLLDSNDTLIMKLKFDVRSNHLIYTNTDHNYQIIYKRQKARG